MKFNGFDRYKPIKVALKKVGLRMDEIVKLGNKTVITASQCEAKNQLPSKENGDKQPKACDDEY